MTGAQASVLQLVLAPAPVVLKENTLLFNRLDLELQISDYYFILLLNHIPARAPILQLLLARAPVLAFLCCSSLLSPQGSKHFTIEVASNQSL